MAAFVTSTFSCVWSCVDLPGRYAVTGHAAALAVIVIAEFTATGAADAAATVSYHRVVGRRRTVMRMMVRMVMATGRRMMRMVRLTVAGRLHLVRRQIERIQFWICVPGFAIIIGNNGSFVGY